MSHNKNIIDKIFTLLFIYLSSFLMNGCGPHTPNSHPHSQSSSRSSESHRIFDSNADYHRDNFNFSQFDGIDWARPQTYGEACPACIGPQSVGIHPYNELPGVGITSDNYFRVSVKGDGSCWIRSAFHAVLFALFNNPTCWDGIEDRIFGLAKKFQPVPGFSKRFRAHDLVTLLKTLKNLTPHERFVQFNKKKVDAFLDYSMRALLHARESMAAGTIDKDKEKALKSLLTDHSWNDARIANGTLALLLLPKEHIYAYVNFESIANSQNQFVSFSRSNQIIPRDGYPKDDKFLQTNRLSYEDLNAHYLQKKQELEPNIDILYQANHPEHQKIRALQKEVSSYERFSFLKKLQSYGPITSLKELHTLPQFRVLSSRASSNHIELIVHKNAAQAFGL